MENGGLTTFALLFMIVSMGGVSVLAAYCFFRILRGSPKGDGAPDEGSGPAL